MSNFCLRAIEAGQGACLLSPMESSLSAHTEPPMCGWLTKQGGRHKSWRRRWFVIRGKQLLYFKEKEDLKPLGVITLSREGHDALLCDVRVVPESEEPKKPYCFEIKCTLLSSLHRACLTALQATVESNVHTIVMQHGMHCFSECHEYPNMFLQRQRPRLVAQGAASDRLLDAWRRNLWR